MTSFTDLADSTITCHDALQLMICMVSPTCTSPSGGGDDNHRPSFVLEVGAGAQTFRDWTPGAAMLCQEMHSEVRRFAEGEVVLSFPGGGWDATITLVLGCVGRQGGVEAGLVWVGLGWTGTGLGWTGPTGL